MHYLVFGINFQIFPSASPVLSRFTSSFAYQPIFVVIATISIHYSITLSLQTQNLRFQQIFPTLTDFWVTTFREFFGRSAHFGQSRDEPCGARVFFVVIHATFHELRSGRFAPNLVTTRSLVSRREIRKDIFKSFFFTLWVIIPKNLKSKVGQTGTSLRAGYTGHGMHCREILL